MTKPQKQKNTDQSRRRPKRSSSSPRSANPLFQRTPPDGAMRGVVVRAHGLWYEVRVDERGGTFIATIRGNLKQQSKLTDIVAVGDRVWITDAGEGEAAIESVEPRQSVFSRIARNTRETEQVILANPDQVLLVFAARDPVPHLRMLDRFIILAERQELPTRIVVTKLDLEQGIGSDDELGPARARFRVYEGIYPVHYISSVNGEGMDCLRDAMSGRISVVAGPSGVGKSSLLNVLDPDNRREIGSVSSATGKGKHTTIGTQLYEIAEGAFIADTPGIRSLAMHAISDDQLDWWYREFRPFLDNCRFRGCAHDHEPGCAVREAVERGDIADQRYQSYLLVRAESGSEATG
ncbi:MAG: ribosome small subunit-dependent GTPase A [Chloroflexota bacterium]|nr:ribosome small subunit-dependent GTPase A [Chloroflexota bacterium]